MIEKRVDDFLDELASKAPTPGGGGAAAIMGAMGAALVSMFCHLTLGKKGYEAVDGEMRQVLQRAEQLRAELAAMVKTDADAFDRVMSAYRLPKDTDAQKQVRSAAIQEALRSATDVPMACARCCAEVIRLSRDAAERGNRNVVSDAGVAVMGAYAGLKSAALNVYINTGRIDDASFSQARVAELEGLLGEGESAAKAVFLAVKDKL